MAPWQVVVGAAVAFVLVSIAAILTADQGSSLTGNDNRETSVLPEVQKSVPVVPEDVTSVMAAR